MGADIHFVVEHKVNEKWIGIFSTDYGYYPPAKVRNYKFFALLAGVRGDGPRVPLGIPKDISELASLCADLWKEDGHSHSYMPVTEFAQCWYQSLYSPDLERKQYIVFDALDIDLYFDEKDWKEFRVVFLFDN